MTIASGHCLCGDVRFQATLPSRWVAHCHCTMCQRSGGSAFMTWVGLDEGQCRIDDPRGLLRWYRSSDLAERGFCSHCGSSLFFRSGRWAVNCMSPWPTSPARSIARRRLTCSGTRTWTGCGSTPPTGCRARTRCRWSKAAQRGARPSGSSSRTVAEAAR